jgi:hypothetical protein
MIPQLLSNTELTENIIKQIIGGNLTGNLTKMMQCLPDI